jgi:Flp pilus assembly CpaE family ATPase
MKILHILKTEPEDSVKKIIEEHRKCNDVEVLDLTENKNYNLIVDFIEKADKVIVW